MATLVWRDFLISFRLSFSSPIGRLVVACHDITADVCERLSCTYRRTPQVTLTASSLVEFPTSVTTIRLPRVVQVVRRASAGGQYLYQPGLTDGETGHPGWSWTSIAGPGIVRAEAGGGER